MYIINSVCISFVDQTVTDLKLNKEMALDFRQKL